MKKYQNSKVLKQIINNSRYDAIGAEKVIFKDLEKVTTLENFDHFLLGDYITDDARIKVFCTEQERKLLESLTEFFIDATCKTCPRFCSIANHSWRLLWSFT